jgi:hypothetical protein
LYFGLGQGLGALTGGMLMHRYGARTMWLQASGITLAAWAACAAAERAWVAPLPQEGCSAAGAARPGSVRRWLARLLPAWRGDGGGGAAANDGAPAGAAARAVLYSELKSKDSGPDLAHIDSV